MRYLRLVTQPEFNAFVAAYSPALTNRMLNNGMIVYEDTSNNAVWPDSLVASFVGASAKKPRAGGWRIPV